MAFVKFSHKHYLSLHCIHHIDYMNIYYTINVPSVINVGSELVMLQYIIIYNKYNISYVCTLQYNYVVILMIIRINTANKKANYEVVTYSKKFSGKNVYGKFGKL